MGVYILQTEKRLTALFDQGVPSEATKADCESALV